MVLNQFRKESDGSEIEATALVGYPGAGFGGLVRRRPGNRNVAGDTL
jgi:hypothetical protein